ncbi:hypothetical protein L596_029395 [Steinernema carpocapsae]|uniref:Uncharacterized protein n=1 Tax=Steinernema carpocapsae TaxID=34508 RepID=A0A4U5LUI3_STECR|nr:hypothetical protein L596_029395 [Steinernema carpocapsae]
MAKQLRMQHENGEKEKKPKKDEKPTAKFATLFKRKTAHYDYPISQPFNGTLEHIKKIEEYQGEPLDQHVSVYHPGRSDEPTGREPEHHPVEEKERGPGFGSRFRFTGLFKKSPAHLDYPVSGVYEGPIDETGKAPDVDGEPLDHHVSVYHQEDLMSQLAENLNIIQLKRKSVDLVLEAGSRVSSKRAQLISTTLSPQSTKDRLMRLEKPLTSMENLLTITSPSITQEDLMSQLAENLNIIQRAWTCPAHLDYPVTAVYEGFIDETGKAPDVDGEPLDHHVSVYHSGRSADPMSQLAENLNIIQLKRKSVDLSVDLVLEAGSRVSSKRAQLISTTLSLESTKDPSMRPPDVDGEPLDHHVSVYHPGRSDEPTGREPEHHPVEEKERGPGFGSRFTGLFKKSPAHLDYPVSGVYEGPIDETGKAPDVDGEPLDHHVSVYHSGRSDEPTGREPENLNIIQLKRKSVDLVLEAGFIDETGKAPDVDGEPLDHHVSVYHSGRSDEPTGREPEHHPVEEKERGPGFGSRFTGLFKKSPAHLDYPVSAVYEGFIDETGKAPDVDGEPLDHHVSVYHQEDPMSQLAENLNIIQLKRKSVDLVLEAGSRVSSKRAQLISTTLSPQSMKDSSMRLEKPLTSMENLLTITSPSITQEDLMSQLAENLNIIQLKRKSVDLVLEAGSRVSSKRAQLISTTLSLESTKDRLMRLEKPLENLLTITSPSITQEDLMSQLAENLNVIQLKRKSVDLVLEAGSRVSSKRAQLPAHLDYPVSGVYEGPIERLEKPLTSMENLLTITSPSITQEDPMSQLAENLNIIQLKRKSVDLVLEAGSRSLQKEPSSS